MSTLTILRNGRIIDPLAHRDEIGDLWVKDGKIIAPLNVVPEDALEYELSGHWLVPGLVDMHVHLREPGEEYKETIASGTEAAAAGGFTAVACMPNTNPINDNASITNFIIEKADNCKARVYPVGAISHKLEGKRLAEVGEMKAAGAVAITDDGLPVVDSQLMRRAMEYGSSHDMLVMSHSEELALSRGGSMHEGELSTRMGVRGIPAEAESIMVHREIALADLTGARIHIAHVSTKKSIELIRSAKKQGIKVTAETAPHYFTLTHEAVSGYDTHAKMNPPLRTEEDRQAILEALQDGTLDAIATDHAPHTVLEKEVEFDMAANGIIGLETSLPLSLELVRKGLIDESRLIELMSCNPAEILSVQGGSLVAGQVADVTVIDPEATYTFSAADCISKGENSPFDGWKMQGRAVMTIVGGNVAFNLLQ